MSEFTSEEQRGVDAFLAQTTLFLGPDPDIMNDHRMAPRTADEDRLLSGPVDANDLDRVRKRIVAGLDEAFEMMEQTGAAPGAKWGDLTSAVYSASGDLIHISTGGVLAFASVLHYPVRFINKYWVDDPSVGVHDGDAFIHNDARYGNIHNTDQSMILPVFYDGELIAWVATIIHEGENGAKEPGGMPSSSESAYDDGIRMSPFKIVERGVIRRDLLTFLQNSVREPKLQYQDLKVKLYSALRIKERVLALVDEVGRDAFIVALRKSLEDIEAEARRRISVLPDGTYRVNFFSDSTLRENVLLKYPCAITVRGDELIIDWRGAAPQIMNRAFNSTLGSSKCGMNQAFLGFFWPDLPRGISVMNPIEVLTDEGSCVNPGLDAPLGQSLQSIFKTFGVTQALFAKMQYSCPEKYGSVIAPWFNQINTFLFGGVTQHGEFVGNVCADLNGMGGGARAHRDGEHSMAPFFAAMADIGEQEIIEDDVPFMQLISKKIKRDAQGFGKYRGGMGYEIAVAARGTPLWGFATVSSGSKFPVIPGLFGGYGCPAYPLAKIKGVNVFEVLQSAPQTWSFDYETLMNTRPFAGARYSTHHMGMGFELAGDSIGRLEHATAEMAAGARCDGRPMFIPQDEFSAWAWLPLGVRRDIAVPAPSIKSIPGSDPIRFAVGEPAPGVAGFRRTHQQALNAQAVALAAGPSGRPVTSFAEVAPLALMSGSIELLRAWVIETLGTLADDDEQGARLRDTLRVFLQENGSYKTTAERLVLHKNTVQYRVRKAEEGLGRSVSQNRLHIELALLASQWLGHAVLRPVDELPTRP